MPKAHILMLTPYLPYPPNSGGRSRTYNLVKHLSKDCWVTLVCFGRPDEKAFDLAPLREVCDLTVVDRPPSPRTRQAAWLSLTSAKPVTMRLYHSRQMEQAIERLLTHSTIGLIHVESFYMLPNLPKHLGVPVLLSEPAIEYIAWGRHAKVARPWYMRPGIALEAYKMRLWEPRAWSEATVVGVMSGVDQEIVRQATPGVKTVLAPNGVDVDYFQPDPDEGRDGRTAVYMGDYKYFPNTDAALYFTQEIMPLIREQRDDFQFTLIGKDPPPDLLALEDDPSLPVSVAGLVDDTRPYLQHSAVFVCPLRSGSGTRFKLLEALACGCPVVSTSVGAEGLGAVDGEHMLIRDTPRDFAQAVISLLKDPALGARLGQQGRTWVMENHAWTRSAARLREVYSQLIGHEDPTLHMDAREKAAFVERLQEALEEIDRQEKSGQ
ncbi:MAG: glycosyltransferase [Chloroflexi bacterium]|nr:glycosyltransferase [Chloroflexota bacterium]